MLIMRELTGGLYFGERRTTEENGVRKAVDTLTYDENEIRRIAIKGFDIARKRKKKVTSVDKANVLDSSRLWRSVVEEVAKDYPEVTLEHMLVDNCAMQLVKDPAKCKKTVFPVPKAFPYLLRIHPVPICPQILSASRSPIREQDTCSHPSDIISPVR